MNDIIITLAPTGPWGQGRNNPIEPAEIIATACECQAAGASVIHLHARDLVGNLTTDMGCLQQSFAGIAGKTEMLIEASTGGLSDFTFFERGLPTTLAGATLGSLNLGSLNFGNAVYTNPPAAVNLWLEQMKTGRIRPSLEIFDTGHIAFAKSLIDQKKLTPPYNFSFIFNVKWGMVFSETLLKYCIAELPGQSNWGIIIVGSDNFSAHLSAAHNGASFVRVGFEDSNVLNGQEAGSNAAMVSALREKLEERGFQIIQGDPVRKKLLGV